MRYMLTVSMLLVAFSLSAQTTASGSVVDAANDEPIIGASILEVGTTNGTITDFDGNFTLNVQSGAKLAISYMGYKTQELVAGPNMFVKMSEDSELLEEVVVVGYGVVKKNDATGSVTAIKPDEMNKALTTTATDMLAGKVAGVVVTSDGGAPGGGANIRIRGGSSLSANNAPLIVIDGLAMDNNGIMGVSNPLSMVNPADIESMTILKDASATAIYGSRASNGVIIITTKKGKAGSKLKVTYEGNVSVSQLVDRVEVLNGDQLRKYANALGMSPEAMSALGNENTDWQSLIYRPAVSTDHNISMMGGVKNDVVEMPYRASVGYTLGNGIVKTNQLQRVTASLNLSPSFLDDHLKFNLNAKGMYAYNQYADGVQGDALSLDPTQPVYDPSNVGFDGYYQRVVEGAFPDIYSHPGEIWYYTYNSMSARNPLSILNHKRDIAHSGDFNGNLDATYKIHGFEDLILHANFGAEYAYGKQKTDWSPYSATGNHYYGRYSWTEKTKYNLLFTCYAQYYKDFNENHHFDAQIGYDWQHFYQKGTSESYGIYPETAIDPALRGTKYDYYGTDVNYWATESYLVSFFGRVNYSALNRYLFTVSLRADGSSKFHKDRRWGYFPAVAIGWKIKEEAFLRDVNWINDLKLRFGYGITGQQDIGGDYPYMGTYDISKKYAFSTLGERATPEFVAALEADGKVKGVDFEVSDDNYIYYYTNRPNVYNPELTWEKTTTYNVGLDFGFLNNRINGAVEYYYRVTDDLINWVNIPGGTNFGAAVDRNIGQLTNMGVEFTFNGVLMDRKHFKWEMGYNFTWNRNRITKLLDSDDPNYFVNAGEIRNGQILKIHKVGYAASSFYVYRTQLNPETGKREIVDTNEDGKITSEDRQIYQNPAAPFTMGLTSKWQFYGFDLGISFRASIGNYVYNNNLSGNIPNVEKGTIYSQKSGGFYNIMVDALHSYYVDGITTKEYGSQFDLLDYFVENASFLRCDNITLGYSFEKKIKGRVYCTVSNPFVISRYKGLDPEVWGGVDYNIYPRSLTVSLGTSLNF